MPFFRHTVKTKSGNSAANPLQVRVLIVIDSIFEKRVLSSAFPEFEEGFEYTGPCGVPEAGISSRDVRIGKVKGSLTVEAAFSLSLFLFFMSVLMTPMKLMNENRRVTLMLETVCEEVSQYACLGYPSGQENIPDSGIPGSDGNALEGMGRGSFGGALTKAGVLLYAGEKVKKACNSKAVTQVSFLRSSVMEDGETIDLIMDYRLKLPFSVLGLGSIPMTARSRRRAWIGKDGNSGWGEDRGEESDIIVYVGKESTRYHKLRTCHYLFNDITAVSYEQLQELRNKSGGKYAACARCGRAAGPGSTVYIMPSGESYHSDRNCSAIASYVRAVPLSEVEYLGPCSYCSE